MCNRLVHRLKDHYIDIITGKAGLGPEMFARKTLWARAGTPVSWLTQADSLVESVGCSH